MKLVEKFKKPLLLLLFAIVGFIIPQTSYAITGFVINIDGGMGI